MFIIILNALVTIVYGTFFLLTKEKSKKNLAALGYLSSIIELNAIYNIMDLNDPTSAWIGSLMILCVLFAQLLVTVLVMLIAREKG